MCIVRTKVPTQRLSGTQLLLFHRKLKGLIAIELKIGDFKPEYALKSASKPIGVSTYDLSNTLPENMKNLLPTPEEIIQRISVLDEKNK